MISDVLSEAVSDINRYLGDPVFADVYPPEADLTKRIKACVTEMEVIQAILDTPPSSDPPSNEPPPFWGTHLPGMEGPTTTLPPVIPPPGA